MGYNISIREAEIDDLRSILELYRDLHEIDDPLPEESELNHIWSEILASPLLKYFVLIYEGEVVSTCALSIILNPPICFLWMNATLWYEKVYLVVMPHMYCGQQFVPRNNFLCSSDRESLGCGLGDYLEVTARLA